MDHKTKASSQGDTISTAPQILVIKTIDQVWEYLAF